MMNYPKLPDYKFSWRSVQVEPIPDSGERITLGAIVKGEDNAVMAAKLVRAAKINKMFGQKFSNRILEALDMAITSAEDFYSNNKISDNWVPPLDGFFVGGCRDSVAENIEEAIVHSARYCSSLSVYLEENKRSDELKIDVFNPQTWRKEIFNQIKVIRVGFEDYFEKAVNLSGSGVPFKFGFISAKYAAHFDTISTNKTIRQEALVRAQSKLWQLDQLRDSSQLFYQDRYELVLYQPAEQEDAFVNDFVEELRNEATRRDLGLYASSSPEKTAQHIIDCAA
jgi:hypothetical protein